MFHLCFLLTLLLPQSKIVQFPDKEIVRRGNFVVAATLDGYLCYGTKQPVTVKCHRAVPLAELDLKPIS